MTFLNAYHGAYNGTGHQINVYQASAENFISEGRGDSYVLKNASVRPEFVLPQEVALNSSSLDTSSEDVYGLRFSMPRVVKVDLLEAYFRFDLVVVSRWYADAVARVIMNNQQPIGADYTDRLFTVDQVVKNTRGELIGCRGFRKHFGVQSLDYYIWAFSNGQNPSLVAARLCYERSCHQIVNGYNDNDFRNKTYQLGCWLRSEEDRRSTHQPLAFNV